MTLIHTALLCEAQNIIEQYKLKKTNSNPKIYSNNSIVVLIGGVGKENTYNSLEYIFTNYTITKALNIGIAGCSNPNISIGTLFCTNHQLKDIFFSQLKTVDTPQLCNSNDNSLYDMEGNHFKNICCKHLNEDNIYIFKVVSDHLDIKEIKKDTVKNLIYKNIPTLNPYILN